MDPAPPASDPPQALEAGNDDLTASYAHAGCPPTQRRQVAANGRRWWRNSAMALNMALPNELFDQLGVPRLAS